MKRLCYISKSDLRKTPYAEIALPCLAKDGWDITVYAPGASESLLRRIVPYPCKAIDIELKSMSFLQEVILLKVLLCARFGAYDVIYINSQSLSARACIAFLGPKFGKKIIYHNPDYYDPFVHPIYYFFEKYFCRKIDLYMNNEFHRGYITQALYRMKCPIITTPPNLPAEWPIPERNPAMRDELFLKMGERKFILMLHGSFGELRMVPELFEALSLLPEHICLVMTGAEVRKVEVDRLLNELGLVDRVMRLPWLSFQELHEYTVNADAGVLLYKNNDLGNFFTAPGRLTEYLACGLPVIASNHTGLENLVLNYNVGLCIESADPTKIAEGIMALEKALKNGQYKKDMMQKVFRKYLSFNNWESIVLESFRNILGEEKIEITPPQFPWLPKR